MSLVVDQTLLAVDPPNDLVQRAEYVQDEFVKLILNVDTQDSEYLGRGIWLAKRAVDEIYASDNPKLAGEIAEIFLTKIEDALHFGHNSKLHRDLNRVITSLLIELEKSAITDQLTGLNNRGYFDRRLKQEVERVSRYGHRPFSLILLDIDHFKKFNDRYGHQTGDDVLRVVSKLIRENQRKSDISGRYGGEEFCYILPETEVSGAKSLAEKLRKSVESFPFVVEIDHDGEIECSPVSLTISIGVSGFEIHQSVDDILRHADQALYQAKHKGRNRVEVI